MVDFAGSLEMLLNIFGKSWINMSIPFLHIQKEFIATVPKVEILHTLIIKNKVTTPFQFIFKGWFLLIFIITIMLLHLLR